MSSSPLRGLDQRLKTRSRRSGIMIGVSVACALALMVGAFSVIFAFLDPFVADFVQDGTGNVPPTRQVAQLAASTPPGSDNTGSTGATEPVGPTATAPPPTAPPAAAPTATPVAFTADYRVTSSSRINFRGGPGVQFPVVTTLAPGTDVQYLNESQTTQNPGADLLAPDGEWLKFRLADGQEGWIRDVDVTQLNP